MAPTQTIKEYFKGKNIFLTGASGFIGKAFIEKLLRSCPETSNIFILLRPKKGKSLQERLDHILSSPLFAKLKQMYPQNLKKLIPIIGDLAAPGLGISDEDKKLLINEVHLVCHAAASVRFDDFLNVAILTNIRATREVALLALEMKKLEVFMHVSTTYCNIDDRKVVEEILYPQHGDWREAIRIAESADNHLLNMLTQKYIDPFPNTYTYSKQLAEHCINDLLVGKVPTVICRPSVVISSFAEPFQGWVDNYNGPVGLLLAGGAGILRTVYGDRNIRPDYLPVDNVVMIMIAAMWHKAVMGNQVTLSIYQASHAHQSHFTQNCTVDLGKKLYWDVPFKNTIWFPGNSMTKCWYNFYLSVLLFHVMPGIFVDLLLKLAGRRPFLFKVQRKIYIANIAICHFTLNEWYFDNTNTTQLHSLMANEEKEEFNFVTLPADEDTLYTFYLNSCDHARRYLLKEYEDVTEETRIRTKRMYYLDRTTKFIFYCLAAWVVFYKVNILNTLMIWLRDYWYSL